MSFLADDDVNLKYKKILKKSKKLPSVEFDSQLVYDKKYIKTRVKKFKDSEILKENTHYSCIAAIYVDSVIKLGKEICPQVNLEQCKFRKTLIYMMMH